MSCLINSDEPLTLSQISKSSGVDKQLVFHHLPKMINQGLVLKHKNEDTKYDCQPALKNEMAEQILESMEPIILLISKNVDASQSDSKDKTVFENLMCLFSILAEQK